MKDWWPDQGVFPASCMWAGDPPPWDTITFKAGKIMDGWIFKGLLLYQPLSAVTEYLSGRTHHWVAQLYHYCSRLCVFIVRSSVWWDVKIKMINSRLHLVLVIHPLVTLRPFVSFSGCINTSSASFWPHPSLQSSCVSMPKPRSEKFRAWTSTRCQLHNTLQKKKTSICRTDFFAKHEWDSSSRDTAEQILAQFDSRIQVSWK